MRVFAIIYEDVANQRWRWEPSHHTLIYVRYHVQLFRTSLLEENRNSLVLLMYHILIWVLLYVLWIQIMRPRECSSNNCQIVRLSIIRSFICLEVTMWQCPRLITGAARQPWMWKSPLNIAISGNRTSLVRLHVVWLIHLTVILPLSLYTFWAKFSSARWLDGGWRCESGEKHDTLVRTCTEVSGVENIGQCGRLSQLSWLLDAL